MENIEKTCGNCKSCMKSVRNDGTGFCVSDHKFTEYHMSLAKPGCRFWEFKMEEEKTDDQLICE